LPSAWALNSRQGAAAERRACAREKRTCAQEAERSERKSFLGRLFFKKGATLPLTLWARSAEKKARETAKRFSRTAECLRCQFAPWAARFARAHRENSARARRGQAALSAPCGGTSPKGGGETRLCASFMAAHILGSPSGGAGAVRRLRGQPASAPHTSVSPRRRLYQRAVHAWGGVTGKRSGNYAGPDGPVREPPARVPCEKPSAGSLFYLPALADAIRP